jgi:hypothetical protein
MARGNVYVADGYTYRVRKIWVSTRVITTIAGTGAMGSTGDGGLAIFAQLNVPTGVAVDASGNVYITEQEGHRVRQVSPSGTISTLAGNGNMAFCGDGGAAANACLRYPYGVAVDGSGNVFIADTSNFRVRKVAAGTRKISTVAGGGSGLGDNGPATKAQLSAFYGVAVFPTAASNSAKSLYIADTGHHRVRRVSLP